MNVPTNNAPAATTPEERTWAAICHASGLVGYLGAPAFFHILAPLVIWLIGRQDKPFLDDQGKEALNFQISLTVYAFLACVLAVPIALLLVISVVGIPFLLLLAFLAIPLTLAFIIAGAVLAIVAAVHASNGERYRYPLTIRFIS